MTLSQKIVAALDENRYALTPPCSVVATRGDDSLTLQLTSLDSVGLALSELEYTSRKRSDWPPDVIRAWGDGLSARVAYLMEPLVVLEVDENAGAVQLRSQSPTTRAEKRSYYEVRIDKNGTLRLGRVVFDEAERRRSPATCQFTREVLERLVDDIAASVP